MGVIRKYTRMYKPQQLSIPFDRAFLEMANALDTENYTNVKVPHDHASGNLKCESVGNYCEE